MAVLHTQAVLTEPTLGGMEEALEKMPCGLNEALEITLQRIECQPNGRKNLGMSTLMWLAYAERPFRMAELADALAIRLGSEKFNPRLRPSRRQMVDCCMGLVTVDEESGIIRLVHHSVHEYLHSHHKVFGFNIELRITELIMTYLLSGPFLLGPLQTEEEIHEFLKNNNFADYASNYWGPHVRRAKDTEADLLALRFVRSKYELWSALQISQYTQGFRQEFWDAGEARSHNGLHAAAMVGLEKLGSLLLENGEAHVSDATGMGTTALIKAASAGHSSFVDMLLRNKADAGLEHWCRILAYSAEVG